VRIAEHRWQAVGAPAAETLEQAVSAAAADLALAERDDLRQRLDDLGARTQGRDAPGLDLTQHDRAQLFTEFLDSIDDTG